MTRVFIAFSISGECRTTLPRIDQSRLNLLVSFYYLKQYDRLSTKVNPSYTMLDSGAFSAWKSNAKININSLIRETLNSRWNESVSLDVVGNAEETLKNSLYMKRKGSGAYPVFHIGEPWEYLERYCDEFPKVGLSCRFGEPLKESYRFIEVCFKKCYPHKFHSFGWVSEGLLTRFPFHSADTANWNNGPSCWGRWKSLDGLRGPKGMKRLTEEAGYYYDLNDKLSQLWAYDMELLERT